jgi:KDO2-lipid IV(A) lauroyltransferase
LWGGGGLRVRRGRCGRPSTSNFQHSTSNIQHPRKDQTPSAFFFDGGLFWDIDTRNADYPRWREPAFLRAMSFWKRFRFRLETAGMRLLAWWIPRLSRGSCVRLGNAVGSLGYLLDARGRAVALANVECALGDSLTPAQRKEVVRASYRNFVRTMLDLFWAPALARPEERHWLRIQGWEELKERAARERRGVVYISLHAGNWEWANLACGFAGAEAIAVAENFRNPALAPMVTQARQVSGMQIIPQENAMLRMLRAVKRGGRTGFLADLSVHPSQAATIVRAFGLEMSASILHAVLAERANALIACIDTFPNRDGSCDAKVSVLDLPDGVTQREIAQACWDYYEPRLRRDPGLWMWPYKHFRYKPRDASRPYPFYANESGAFEKLRKSVLG